MTTSSLILPLPGRRFLPTRTPRRSPSDRDQQSHHHSTVILCGEVLLVLAYEKERPRATEQAADQRGLQSRYFGRGVWGLGAARMEAVVAGVRLGGAPLQCQCPRTRTNGGGLLHRMLWSEPALKCSVRRWDVKGRRLDVKGRRLDVKGRRLDVKGRRLNVTCETKATVLTVPLKQLTLSEPKVERKYVKAFAPATVANLGPGFDFLGCAVDGLGDYVTAEVSDAVPAGEIRIEAITGDNGRLSCVCGENCAGIAGRATLELLGVQSVGISLNLHKGLPLGSGLGSSAASAAAAAAAVNGLFGSPLSKAELVHAGLESEATVSGYHADNVAPSLMGGFVLVRSYSPLHLIPLSFPSGKDLYFVLVIPDFEAPTKEMRAVLPKEISMKKHIANCSQASALVTAILQGDPSLLGAALSSDSIVEPQRAPLIPGMSAVIAASTKAGAYGCTISGAGPTAVAITDSAEKGKAVAAAMVKAFQDHGGLNAHAHVNRLDREGARIVDYK